MRAAVCRAFGEPLVIEDLRLDPVGPDEVRVEVAACAICHSDIHYADGSWGGALPAVYGHEAAGIVVEAGGAVTGVTVGDRVSISLIRSCGACAQCQRGYEVFCEAALGPPGRRLRTIDSERVEASLRCGAFAEEAVVHRSQVVRLPDDLDWPAAALLGCGVITGIGAVLNTSTVDETSTVAVVGLGGVGLNAVQGAALAGAPVIVAIDTQDHKLATARGFGATHTVNASDDVLAAVRQATGSRGATHAFVTVGSAAAVRSTLDLVVPGGETVIVGMPGAGSRLEIDPLELADTGRRIIGCKMGSARPQRDIQRIVEWCRDGAVKLDELVSGIYPLEEINQAIAEVKRGEAIRNVITMRDLREASS